MYNTFQEDDQAICETFNLKSGNHYYWRLVTGTGDDYIDLSKDDCASGSDIPLAGNSIVQLGNRTTRADKVPLYGTALPPEGLTCAYIMG